MNKKIIIDDLYYKRETNNRYIFKDLNLEIKKEKGIIFVLGPSGQGKSTFLHLLNGLLNPEKGTIKINDNDITNQKEFDSKMFWEKTCSLMYQNFPLVSWLNCKENLDLVSTSLNVDSMSEKLDVKKLYKKYPQKISFGQRQRIALIQTFIAPTTIKLLDEPTSSLGDEDKFKVMSLIANIAEEFNHLFIIATHDKDLIEFADSIYKIKNRKLEKIR